MRHKQTKSFGAKKSESAAPMWRGIATPEKCAQKRMLPILPHISHTCAYASLACCLPLALALALRGQARHACVCLLRGSLPLIFKHFRHLEDKRR